MALSVEPPPAFDARITTNTNANTPVNFRVSSVFMESSHCEEIRTDLTDHLCIRIVIEYTDGIAEMDGLCLAASQFLSVDAEPSVVAFTCRHVVSRSVAEDLEPYRRSNFKSLTA